MNQTNKTINCDDTVQPSAAPLTSIMSLTLSTSTFCLKFYTQMGFIYSLVIALVSAQW